MRYIIGVFGAILVLLVVFVLIFTKGNDSNPATTPAPIHLVDYAAKNSTVSYTTVGSVVGEEQQRNIRIVVTPTERRLEILSGFGQDTLSSQSFPNTAVGYENFLSALGGQGFTSSKKTSIEDPRSICPQGQRFEYVVTNDGQSVSDLWSVSCDRSGTFNGRASIVQSLFQAQIPDYSTLTSDVTL